MELRLRILDCLFSEFFAEIWRKKVLKQCCAFHKVNIKLIYIITSSIYILLFSRISNFHIKSKQHIEFYIFYA